MNCNRTTHGLIRSFVVRLLYISIQILGSGYQDCIGATTDMVIGRMVSFINPRLG